MSDTNVYFGLRHGQSKANVAGIIVSDPVVGCSQYGLTATGVGQVRASVAELAGHPASWTVMSSDFLRARQTAALAAEALGVEVVSEPLLRERFFGAHDMTSTPYERVWELDAVDPAHTSDGVESVVAVAARIRALLHRCETTLAGQHVLWVAHGDVLQIAHALMSGRSLAAHRRRPPWLTGTLEDLGSAGPAD